jgi:hypothetical protein
MKVEEAKGVSKDRSKWKEVISAYLWSTLIVPINGWLDVDETCLVISTLYNSPSYPFPTKWGRYNMFFIML